MNNPLPSDEKTETLILGCIFNSASAANAIFSEIDDSDFVNPKHQEIFSYAKSLYLKDSPIDITSMIYSFQQSSSLEKAGGTEYLFAIANNIWSGAPYEEFIKSLKNTSGLRKLMYSSKDAFFKAAAKDANCDEIRSELQASLYKNQGIDGKQLRSSKDVFNKFSEHGNFNQNLNWMHERALKGLPTYDGISSGYPTLDHALGFFRNSCIYYVGARTSMGKTTFMLNLIRNMLNKKIGIFSLEMPAEIILAKLLCMDCRVPYSLYEDGRLSQENMERLLENSKKLENAQIFIEDPSSITLQTLSLRAKRMASNYEIDMLFIDYLTRIRSNTKHASKHLEVDEISKGLQSLAKELKIPILCLCQLNRQAAGTEENVRKPSLKDFRESGSIEEDADACLLLHRPEYYNPINKPGIIELNIAKNRLRGITKTIEFNCRKFESDVYEEAKTVEEQIKQANEEKSYNEFENHMKRNWHKDE